MALVLALGVMTALSFTAVGVIEYTSGNARTTTHSKAGENAYALAEAGLNNALATLGNPDNNALVSSTLPATEATAVSLQYEGGTAKWWGVRAGTQWTVYGLGLVRNPTGPAAPQIRRLVTATVRITSSLTQRLNNQAWNYLFAKNTGQTCDMTMRNYVTIDASLYVNGNLCLDNFAKIAAAPAPEQTFLVVRGRLNLLKRDTTVGTAAARIAEAHVVGGCTWQGSPLHSPCSSADNVFANLVDSSATEIAAPVADFAYWYENAQPGPRSLCTVGAGVSTTAFENETTGATRNASAGAFNLTPSTDYSCVSLDLATGEVRGQLTWIALTRTLIVKGAVYIDGSAYVDNNAVNQYNGQASLYLSGTFRIGNGAQLCGAIVAGNCDFNAWNPNTELLAIVADGNDGSGNSVLLTQSARFQGALYGTNAIHLSQSSQSDGPMVAGTFVLENSVITHAFPLVETVPIGMPGNPNVYAQPNAPENYSG